MKRFAFILAVLFMAFSLNAANNIQNLSSDQGNNIELISSNINESVVEFTLSNFSYSEVETSQGMAWSLSAEGAIGRLEAGKPQLPLFTNSLVIPNTAKMNIEILQSDFTEYKDVLIAPSKGNLSRTIDPTTVDYTFGEQYSKNEFFPSSIVTARQPYIIRDLRGQALLINPFVYNPISKSLRVYNKIKIRFYAKGTSTVNTLPAEQQLSKVDDNYSKIYSKHFINYNTTFGRYTPVDEHGNMLIISYGDFMDEMDDYIDWKTKTGTNVEIVDVATIGGSSQIKTYIADYYNDNGLTFVLLVGDSQQVPSSMTGGNDSDNNYTYIVGNDHYPDIFIGRFSAQTSDHVTTQVERTINYERYPLQMSGWFDNAIGIASDQGPGDDNELDYEHIRNISNNKLIPFTYSYAYELFDGSQGGEDESGNPTPSQVAAAVNSGATIINYTGHGSNTSWGTSGFSSSDVNNLTNNDKLPFIISVACVNGNFVGTTCFAEAWLRATNNGEPAGAVATLMSTINQSWNPPMEGQDDMNDILTEADANNIKRTFGGITMNGCMAMNDAYGTDGEEMTDTWTIFGDPSLMVRTDIPQTMTVNYAPSVALGATSFAVNCDVDDALAVLSMNGEIIGSAYVSGGIANITFPPLTDIGTMDLVITAFNYFPYEGTVDITSDSGPFIMYAFNVLNDTAGNDNAEIDYAEDIYLTIGLTNAGNEDAINVSANISTNSEYISISDNEEVYGDIALGDTVSVTDGFHFLVSENIPDGSVVGFTITATDDQGSDPWESTFELTAHAPELGMISFTINDAAGNQNGIIDPGEDADIEISLKNSGSSKAFNVEGLLSTQSTYITINTSDLVYGDIDSLETATATYNVSASETTPEGTNVDFLLNISADYNLSETSNFSLFVGQKPVLLVNYSTAVNSEQEMMACYSELNVGADEATSLDGLELSKYKSIFIILGAFPNNHILTSEEGDLLSAYLDNGGRLYMEGADTWAMDEQTSVHPYFNINGLADGSDDCSRVIGYEGSWLEGFAFDFAGANNYIDRIAPMNGAEVIMQNESPGYGITIAFENETYKTIGSSIDFGGLQDEEGSNKDGLMAEYLYYFGIDYIWTGISSNQENKIQSNVYPNPASDIVNIAFENKNAGNITLSITNLSGKMVYTENIDNAASGAYKFSWNATGVESGVYFYNLNTANGISTGKIVLTK